MGFKNNQYLNSVNSRYCNKKRVIAGLMVGALTFPLALPIKQAMAMEDSNVLHGVREVQKTMLKAINAVDTEIQADNYRGDDLLPSDAELKKELDIKQIVNGNWYKYCIILKNDGTLLGLGDKQSLGLKQDATVWTKLPLTGVKTIYTTSFTTYALCKNGDVWSVGDNAQGQRAVGDTSVHEGWTKVNMEDVKDIACSSNQVVFLKTNGDVWGAGSGNELGMSGTVTRPVKLAVDNVKAVFSTPWLDTNGGNHSTVFYIRRDGEIRRNIIEKVSKLDWSQVEFICSNTNSTKVLANDHSGRKGSCLNILYKNKKLYRINCDGEKPGDLETFLLQSNVSDVKLNPVTKDIYGTQDGNQVLLETKWEKFRHSEEKTVNKKIARINFKYSYDVMVDNDGSLWCEKSLGSLTENREKLTCLNSIILDGTIDTINSVYNYEDLYKYQELKLGLLGRERYTKEHIYFADNKVTALYDLSESEKTSKYIFRCQNGDALIQNKADNKIQFVKMGTKDLQNVTGKIDTPITKAFTGVVDTKMVSMVELKDGNIAWLDGTVLKELPLAVKDMKSNFLFRTKDGVKMFFQKQDGTLWWYDSSSKEHEVLGVNMRHVKDICKGQYGNTDLFVMDDATLLTAERPLLIDGRKVVERLSDGFLRLNDDKVYVRQGDLDLKEVCDYKDYKWCTNLQLVCKNNKVYSLKSLNFASKWAVISNWGKGDIPETKFITDLNTDLLMYFDTKGIYTLSTGATDWSTMDSTSTLSHIDVSKNIPDYKQIIGAYYVGNTEYLLLKDGTFRSITDGSPLTSARIVGTTINKMKAKSKLNFDVAKDAKEAIIELEAGDVSNILGIRNMLDKISDESERNTLWERFRRALEKIEPALAEITKLIKDFNDNPARDTLDKLDIEILKLKDSTMKAEYQEIADNLREKYKQTLLKDALKAIDEGNKLPTQNNYDLAENAVNKVENGDDKDDLLSRLQDLKELLKENEEVLKVYNKALQDYISNPTSENYDNCKSAIDNIENKNLKDKAFEDLEKEYQKVLVAESEILVRNAEDSKLLTDIEKAKAKVNLITDSSVKDKFIQRLNTINTSNNPENVDTPDALAKVSQLVDKAVASGKEEDVTKAKEEIDKLKYLEHKFIYNSKLALVEKNLDIDMTPFSKPASAETSFQVQMGVLPNITIQVDKPFVDLGNVDLVKDTTLENPIHVLVNSNMPYDVSAKSDDIKATKGNGTIPADHLMLGLDDNSIRPLAKDREVHLAESIQTGDKVFGTKFKFKQYKDARPGVYRTTVRLVARQK